MIDYKVINYQCLLDALENIPELRQWAKVLPEQIEQGLSPTRWGDLPQWQGVLDQLPDLTPSTLNFKNHVQIGAAADCSDAQREQLKQLLMGLHPWRKGPYALFGLDIDTEWRSDLKWQRLQAEIEPLVDRLVLDVGCGNGYHCWRMLGDGARRVIGIDPSPRFIHQFYALEYFAEKARADLPVDILPLSIEAMPTELKAFDTVFSMGVLYHRRSPMDHLRELKDLLRPGGQLVLETLVIDNIDTDHTLVPEGRYAKMRNVWFIPTPNTLLSWLRKCGFKAEICIDVCPTSHEEQRRTEWMTFESLADFVDTENPALTFEGHPAPVRAIFTATA
ncbi:MAG: tRNA 5-methoxyuridine(34)/uridine 5-oxyacetic acid(34) synthase CmoB [Porticoccaceae bacterium]|nr:tRNA 5-methoxyuridine(34)/uridine 5-oxyacetic acid(34) synthase CmoB [Porticoccaceae bacterium]